MRYSVVVFFVSDCDVTQKKESFLPVDVSLLVVPLVEFVVETAFVVVVFADGAVDDDDVLVFVLLLLLLPLPDDDDEFVVTFFAGGIALGDAV